MPDKLAELRRMVGDMTPGEWRTGPINYADIYSEDSDGPIALVVKDEDCTVGDATGIVALRNNALALLDVCEAAERAVDAYWGAGNELAAMQDVRAALEKFGSRELNAAEVVRALRDEPWRGRDAE